jgi:hydroxymethylpyrimidine/phosphomethylpyrimidine kinase
MRPVVLSIAGSDPSGGAGIQADVKAIEANGGYAAAAITAVTVQSSRGALRSLVLDAGWVAAQIDAVLEDLPVCAVKSGMLGDESVAARVADSLLGSGVPAYVCDPVLVSSSGHALLTAGGLEVVRDRLLPLATLITPNAGEAAALTGRRVNSVEEAKEAGRALIDRGARAVLVTGGHFHDRPAIDVLVLPEGFELLEGEHLDALHTHGTGCNLSSAIATGLARGLELLEAIASAKRFVTDAIRHGLGLGAGVGPVDPLHVLHARREP